MRRYKVIQRPEKLNWADIPVAPIDCLLWTTQSDIRAQAQLCWDKDALYVRLCAWEKDIRAEHRTPMQRVCEDSCLEFFLSIGSDNRYFNFEFNPNCALYLGFGSLRSTRMHMQVKKEQWYFEPEAKLFDGGWDISYKIPLIFIQEFYPDFKFKAGVKMRGNFYKCGDKTTQPHYLAWNPVRSEIPNLHSPKFFGHISLTN